MAVLSHHQITEGLLGAGSLSAVIVGAAALDETFRGFLSGLLAGEPSGALAVANGRAQSVAAMVMETVRTQGTEHTGLVLLALGAGALVLLLMRL